jgi:hypothetical protein
MEHPHFDRESLEGYGVDVTTVLRRSVGGWRIGL